MLFITQETCHVSEGYLSRFAQKSNHVVLVTLSAIKGPFIQAIFVSQRQCNFCRAEVAASCDFIAILVQFVGAKHQYMSISKSSCFTMSCISNRGDKLHLNPTTQLVYTRDFEVATSALQKLH